MGDRTEQFENHESKPEGKQAFIGIDLLMEGKQLAQNVQSTDNDFTKRVRDPQSLELAQKEFEQRFKDAMALESPGEMAKLFDENKQMLQQARDYIASIGKALDDYA